MLIKKVSLAIMTNLLDLIEAELTDPAYKFALLLDTLTDPPRSSDWATIYSHEASYSGYAKQSFDREDIIGPENWDEGHLLRFPQTSFVNSGSSQDVRWIAAIVQGVGESHILALEKLGVVWDPSTASEPLEHVLKIRTRLALP